MFTTDEGVVRIDPDGTDRRVIAPVSEDPDGRLRYGAADLSPDGDQVVFTGCSEGAPVYFPNCDLLVVGIDGEGLRALPLGRGLAPSWSPDGRRIAFLGPVGSRDAEVRVAALDGSGMQSFGAGSDPTWMPDGRSLLFGRVVSSRDGFVSSAMVVVPVDGGGPARQLGPVLSGEMSDPTVSTDGTTIAFRRNQRVTLLNIDGSGLRDLHPADVTVPPGEVAWSPDGSRLALPGVPGTADRAIAVEDVTIVPTDQTISALPGTQGATSVAWAAGIRRTACPGGYRLVAADGGVFTFGDARFAGSAAGHRLRAPIVGVADLGRTEAVGEPEYHLVAADGGVFSYSTQGGSDLGSPAELGLPGPWAAMSLDPTGSSGYWVTAADGRIFDTGGVRQLRSADRPGLGSTVVGTAASGTDALMAATADGGVVPYGEARWCGSRAGKPLAQPVVGIAAVPAPA